MGKCGTKIQPETTYKRAENNSMNNGNHSTKQIIVPSNMHIKPTSICKTDSTNSLNSSGKIDHSLLSPNDIEYTSKSSNKTSSLLYLTRTDSISTAHRLSTNTPTPCDSLSDISYIESYQRECNFTEELKQEIYDMDNKIDHKHKQSLSIQKEVDKMLMDEIKEDNKIPPPSLSKDDSDEHEYKSLSYKSSPLPSIPYMTPSPNKSIEIESSESSEETAFPFGCNKKKASIPPLYTFYFNVINLQNDEDRQNIYMIGTKIDGVTSITANMQTHIVTVYGLNEDIQSLLLSSLIGHGFKVRTDDETKSSQQPKNIITRVTRRRSSSQYQTKVFGVNFGYIIT